MSVSLSKRVTADFENMVNGSAVTVTQSVNDLYDSPTGKAIAENSANMYLLGQKAETINALKKEGRLPLGEGGYEYLKTVHTVTGVYSEIFFITDLAMGTGIGRFFSSSIRFTSCCIRPVQKM